MTDPAHVALAVDDDVFIVMDVCDILADAGFQCFDATSADEALPILEHRWDEITLLFSDAEMSGTMDGFGLARHVAEHWHNIEIVIASGNIMPAAGDMPEKATFIAKPFSGDLVRDHLRSKLPPEKTPPPLAE